MANPTLILVARTDVGQLREHNEDNFIVSTDLAAERWLVPSEAVELTASGALMVVADGMGGTQAGEIASALTVAEMRDFFQKKEQNSLKSTVLTPTECQKRLGESIEKAHKSIVERAAKDPKTHGMGTTVVAVWLVGTTAHIAWAGDSRCYVFNPSSGLRQLTKDHSYVQTLVDSGAITAEQAFHHPDSNVILQSLGDPKRRPKTDFATYACQPNDCLLLCSDGLNGMLEDYEIERICRENSEKPNVLSEKLITAANKAGGADNITVVIGKVSGDFLSASSVGQSHFSTTASDGKRKPSRTAMMALMVFLLLGAGLWVWILKADFLTMPSRHPSVSGVDSTQNAATNTPTNAVTNNFENKENKSPKSGHIVESSSINKKQGKGKDTAHLPPKIPIDTATKIKKGNTQKDTPKDPFKELTKIDTSTLKNE